MWLGIRLLQIHCLYTSINPKLYWALFACSTIPCLGFGPKVEQKKMYNRRKSQWQKGRRRIHKVSAGVRPRIFGPMRWCSLCCVFRQATALPLANLFASCFVCDMTGQPEKSPILSNWKGAPCSHCSGIRQSSVNKLIQLSCLYTGTRL